MMDPLPEYKNWMVPVPKVLLFGDKFDRNFNHHTHCGLQNLGNTCFVNSSLQALLHLPVFTNWLVADKFHFQKCSNKFCVTCILSLTVKQMLEGGKVVWATDLCGVLQALGFQLGAQEDVNEFLVSLMGSIRQEYLWRYPQFEGVLDYCSEHTAPTDLMFGFWMQTKVFCGVCQFESVTYSFIQELHIPLAGTVQQGLSDFFANENLEVKCSNLSCKQTSLCSKKISPYNSPEVLLIHLRRFNDYMEKNSEKVVVNERVKVGDSAFELKSIIVHYGTSRHQGHYAAYAKCPDNKWTYFSDTQVLSKESKDLRGDDVQKNVYILFYQKISNNTNKLFPKELPKFSSPIGQQPFLISPMKSKAISKVPSEKLDVVEEDGEVRNLADQLIWSTDSDGTEATAVTFNSRREKRKLFSQPPQQPADADAVPEKIRIQRTLRTSPKASSSQSCHDYNIIREDMKSGSIEMRSPQQPTAVPEKIRIKRTLRTSPKASSSQSCHEYKILQNVMETKCTKMRSPVKPLKISRTKRLSPKANSAVSEHIYKVIRSPLKKFKILRSKRISPKANSTQSEHVYKLKQCGDEENVGASPEVSTPDSCNQKGKEDEAVSPPASLLHSDIFNKSFGTYCDLMDNRDKHNSPNKSHDLLSSPPKNYVAPTSFPSASQETPIWNVDLYEHEVEGAILPHKKLNENTLKQLTRWLRCRGITTVGNKPKLIELVQACIDDGNSHLLDFKVDNGFPYRMKLQKLYPKQNFAANNVPKTGWGSFVSVSIPKLFNYGHIYNYLVETAPQLPIPEHGPSQEEIFDALESEDEDSNADLLKKDPFEDSECPCLMDEKSLRRGMKFLKSGHVHSLIDKLHKNVYHVEAAVASSMPGNDKTTVVTCTSKPCVWNRGSKKTQPGEIKGKVYPSKIYDTVRRATFNPQPSAFKQLLEESSEEVFNTFICDLTANESTLWSIYLDIGYKNFELTQEYLDLYVKLHEQFTESLRCLIPEGHSQPYYEHPGTELQHKSPQWHILRTLFITASVAKQVARLTDRGAKNYLKSHLWGLGKNEDDNELFPAMKHGIDNEPVARECYLKKMQETFPNAEIKLLGLCQSVEYPELACSPDSVLEPDWPYLKRANEIKCPFRLREIDPNVFDTSLEDEQLKDFYLYRDESGDIKLKEDHAYYFQIQMVMGILGLLVCDLIVWSPKGMAIVPINFDPEFWKELALVLVEVHHSLIKPEYFLQRTPRDLEPVILDITFE